MILKGSQRAGGRQMALHLLNGEQNEHVNVHEVRGFIASDVLGALNEAYALSKGTQCKQFMYSLSLSPPETEKVDIATFEYTLDRVEKKLGLEGQPRVVVFHEKEGRRHAHCVWSRIDCENMKAINISHPKIKLKDLAKSLYLEHGWKMPEGFRDKSRKNPLNYTRAEWQQAARIGRKAPDIKREIQECWAVSDTKATFENALGEQGYYLARGNKRGFVVIDVHGEVYSLARQLGQKAKSLEGRLGKPSALPSVEAIKSNVQGKLKNLFKKYADELQSQHRAQLQPLLDAKKQMVALQRALRSTLHEYQEKRWHAEEMKRSARIRNGFKGLWDKLNGKYWKTRKRNEQEAWQAYIRDRKQREEMIFKQLSERQQLQQQFKQLQAVQLKERQALIKDLNHVSKHQPSSQIKGLDNKRKNQSSVQKYDDKDYGPEI